MALNKKIENLVLHIDPQNQLVKVLRNFGDSQKDVVIEHLSCDKEVFENKRIFEALDNVLSAYVAESPVGQQTDVYFVLADYYISTDIIVLPVMPQGKLKDALWAELRKTYPHFETMHFSTTILQKNKKRVVFGVSMLAKTIIQDCVLVAKKYGLSLKNISFASNANINAVLALGAKLKQENFLFLDIKEEKSSIVYVANQKTASFLNLPFGQNVLSEKTSMLLPNFIDSSLAEQEVFATTHLSAVEQPTFFAGTMDEIEARSFQNFQKNKKDERLATEKFLKTYATHKNTLQKNFSIFLRYINAIKNIFEEYSLPKPEAVIVNLPEGLHSAIAQSGLDMPIEPIQDQLVSQSLLLEYFDLFGMIYCGKYNSGQNFLS